MLIVPIEEARPGMKLVMTVVHPEHPDQDLLKPGFILDPPVLRRLAHIGVPFVYVDYPDLGELDNLLSPHLSPQRQRIYGQIKQTIAAVQKTARPSVCFPDYYAATRDMVLTLLQQGQHPVYLDVICARMGMDAIGHATAVAQLALTLGIRLEQYLISQRHRLPVRHAREVVNLGVAAMLHDIGKVRLPAHLQSHDGVFPPEKDNDRREWETHPQIGHDMLTGGIEPSAAASVLHHHQHHDGSGFPAVARPGRTPETRAGQGIHVFARILLVADLYERLTMLPGGRHRRTIEILHLMRTQYADWIDPYVLQVLPAVVPPFPPGSRVTLSDGSRAVVTGIQPLDPFRPTIKRLGEDNWTLVGESLSLRDQRDLSIQSLEGLKVAHMTDWPVAAAGQAASVQAA